MLITLCNSQDVLSPFSSVYLKLKSKHYLESVGERKCWRLIPTFVKVVVGVGVGGLFCPASRIGLRINTSLSKGVRCNEWELIFWSLFFDWLLLIFFILIFFFSNLFRFFILLENQCIKCMKNVDQWEFNLKDVSDDNLIFL